MIVKIIKQILNFENKSFLPTDVTNILLEMINLKNNYNNYEHALKILDLDALDKRRKNLCHEFATKCTQNPQTSSMFPLNPGYLNHYVRMPQKYMVKETITERLRTSAILYMQRLLNEFTTI